ncbi:MAG: outer membrane protein transport protein [Steroidobacteraceae bacterium]
MRYVARWPGTATGAAFLLMPISAHAANGYTQYGYGTASKAMGGVSYALPMDSLIPSSNPAGLTQVGERLDVGVDWLSPRRGAKIKGNSTAPLVSADGAYDANEIKQFFVPEFGFSRDYNETLSYGVAVYGNGGLNTEYAENPFAAFGATGNAGVDIAQVFVSPTIAWRINEHHSVGLAVNLAYQQMKVYGLGIFGTESFPGPFSQSPDHVSDKGYDRSWGIGYRLGWFFEPVEGVSIGLSWQPETRMSRFDKYKGLIRDQGRLNIPPNYGLGVSWRVVDRVTLAFDVQRIDYDTVPALGKTLQPFIAGELLGAGNGPGFGWRDMTIYKLGMAYQVNAKLKLLAGFSDTRAPIPADQTMLNIVAPAILEKHYTAGFIYEQKSLSFAAYYFYAPRVTVRGKGSIPPTTASNPFPPQSFGGGEVDLSAHGQTAGVSLTWRY